LDAQAEVRSLPPQLLNTLGNQSATNVLSLR
jgi:hypothetical protein